MKKKMKKTKKKTKKTKKVKAKVAKKSTRKKGSKQKQQQEYEDFYKKLRRRIKKQLNAWKKKKKGKKRTTYDVLVELLLLLPDLFHLSVKLLFDKKVPTKNKGWLFAGIGYVIFPFDLIPDMIPVVGYIDDLIVMVIMLDKFLDIKDKRVKAAVKRHWAGDEDVFKVVKHILEVVDSTTETFLITLVKKIKQMFKGK